MATKYDFNEVLDALKLAQAHISWCWDKIETNTKLHREGSNTVHLKIASAITSAIASAIASAITEAQQANDWLTDNNIQLLRQEGLLRATGKLDAIESVQDDPPPGTRHDGKGGYIIPDVVIQDNRTGTQTPRPTDAELSANHKALREAFAAPGGEQSLATGDGIAAPLQSQRTLQTYSVTWRRPTAAYAHDEIEATSAEDALMQAKVRVTSRNKFDGGSFPHFETDSDSMDACDWISVEGEYDIDTPHVEHVEWEQPKLSPGKLMAALARARDYIADDLQDSSRDEDAEAFAVLDAITDAMNSVVPDYE